MWHSIFSWSSFLLETIINSVPVKSEKWCEVGSITSIPWVLLYTVSLNPKVLYMISSTVCSTQWPYLTTGNQKNVAWGSIWVTVYFGRGVLVSLPIWKLDIPCSAQVSWSEFFHYYMFELPLLKEHVAPLNFGKPSLCSRWLKGDIPPPFLRHSWDIFWLGKEEVEGRVLS